MAWQSGGSGGHSDLVLINTLHAAAGDASIDFTGIPGTYADLVFRGELGSSYNGAPVDPLHVNLNKPAANSFFYTSIKVAGAAPTVTSSSGNSVLVLGEVEASQIEASGGGMVDLIIRNYASPIKWPFMSGGTVTWDTSSGTMFQVGGFLNFLGAVTAVSFFPTNGPLIAGSYMSLYGLKG